MEKSRSYSSLANLLDPKSVDVAVAQGSHGDVIRSSSFDSSYQSEVRSIKYSYLIIALLILLYV